MTDIEFTWGSHGMSLRINDESTKTEKAIEIVKDIALWVRLEEDKAVDKRTDKMVEDMQKMQEGQGCEGEGCCGVDEGSKRPMPPEMFG